MSNNDQRSLEWRKERLSRITASRFADAMGSVSARASYAKQIRHEMKLLERINAGEVVAFDPDFYSAATAWGEQWEPVARREYEWRYEVTVAVPPFRAHPVYPFIGCSADGFVLEADGEVGIEIKCPYDQRVHANTLAHGMSDDHRPQVQGEMFVNGFSVIDFISFDPRLKGADGWFERRVERDEKFIAHMEAKLLAFWEFVKSGKDYPEDAARPTVPVLF